MIRLYSRGIYLKFRLSQKQCMQSFSNAISGSCEDINISMNPVVDFNNSMEVISVQNRLEISSVFARYMTELGQ